MSNVKDNTFFIKKNLMEINLCSIKKKIMSNGN